MKRFDIIIDGHYPDEHCRDYCDDGEFVDAKTAVDLLETCVALVGWFDSDTRESADRYIKKARTAIAKSKRRTVMSKHTPGNQGEQA